MPGPSYFDYFLLITGIAISLLLGNMSGLQIDAANTVGLAKAYRVTLPQLLFLPMGAVLFWPIFFGIQRLMGRELGMTLGEWLWGLAWLGNLFFASWFLWHGLGSMPVALADLHTKIAAGYVLFLFAMSVIAILLFLVDLVRSSPLPWTHRFCLALLGWPILPLAAIYFGKLSFVS